MQTHESALSSFHFCIVSNSSKKLPIEFFFYPKLPFFSCAYEMQMFLLNDFFYCILLKDYPCFCFKDVEKMNFSVVPYDLTNTRTVQGIFLWNMCPLCPDLVLFLVCFQVTISCGDDISCMREDPAEPSRVATGGKENCLKIYDLNRPDVGTVFKAKNVSLALGQSMWLCYKYIQLLNLTYCGLYTFVDELQYYLY